MGCCNCKDVSVEEVLEPSDPQDPTPELGPEPVEIIVADLVDPKQKRRTDSKVEQPTDPIARKRVKLEGEKSVKPRDDQVIKRTTEEVIKPAVEEPVKQIVEPIVGTNIDDEFESESWAIPDQFLDTIVDDPEAFNQMLVQQRQAAINNTSYRSTTESWQPNSLEQLAQTLKTFSRGKGTIDRHWLIFYWIAINIEYDTVSYFTKNYVDQTAEGVFRTRKGVCAGYANIYKYLCDALELPCEVVGGYSKGYGFDDRDGAPMETDHAWNAVEIYSHWYLLDSTWGAGHLNDKKLFERKLNAYYFLARPNEMIYHHLPEDKKWQLLQTPVEMAQYMQMPKLRPLYFEFKLEMIRPRNQCSVSLTRDQSFALVVTKAPSDVSLLADLKLHDQVVEGGNSVIFDKKKRVYNCYFAPASVGKHKITIYAKRGDTDIGTFESVLDLALKIDEMPPNPISYPKTWKIFYDLRMKVIAPLNTHSISLGKGEKFAQLLIHTPADVELLGNLKNNEDEQVSCGDRVYYDREKDYWRCQFAPGQNGTFDALILAKRKADSGFYHSAISFKIRASRVRSPPFSFPKTWNLFYDLNLKVVSPTGQGIIMLDDETPSVEVQIEAPDDVALLCGLEKENSEKIDNGGNIYYDGDYHFWRCTFAPSEGGMFKASIFAKKKSEPGQYSSAVSFILNARQLSSGHVSVLDTTQLFYDLKLKVLSPDGGSSIILPSKASFVEICLKTPSDVELLGQLNDARKREISYADEVYYDRRKDIWRCRFAPNANGLFDAIIMAKKKSDDGKYKGVITYHLEANHIRTPPLTFPKTWQLFYDLDLKIKAPRARSTAVWPDNTSYSEVLIQAPNDVQLSCQITDGGERVENGTLTHYNDEKDLWQLLFAPEQTGEHKLTVFAGRMNNSSNTMESVAMFLLQVTHLERPMKFPITYTEFRTSRCRIYTPLDGRLKKGSVVSFHCRIPNATGVTVMVDSTMLREEGYNDPIFQRTITVGSNEVAICAKFGQTSNYNVLIKYTVEKNV